MIDLIINENIELLNPFLLAKYLGIKITYSKLGAERKGLEAALIPMLENFRHPFTIVCDSWVPPQQNAIRIQADRVGHELAHTFFYSWEVRPPHTNINGWEYDPVLEEFCHNFAVFLLQQADAYGVTIYEIT